MVVYIVRLVFFFGFFLVFRIRDLGVSILCVKGLRDEVEDGG